MEKERRIEAVRTDLIERTRAAVAGRIGRVCAHLEPEDFQALVARIAEIEIKYSMRRDQSFFVSDGER